MNPSTIFARALSVLLLGLCLPLMGAWEDTGVPVRQTRPRAPENTSRPPPASRPRSRGVPLEPRPALEPSAPRVQGVVPRDLYSTFLDTPGEAEKRFRLMLPLPAPVGAGDQDLTIGEVDARFVLADWRNVLAGDMGLDFRLHSMFFGGDAGMELMPTALLALPLDFRWTWRYLHGGSLQVGAAPGIYSDAEALGGDMFGLPFHLSWYQVIHPRFSWMAGVEIRPGWDLVVWPLIGFAWEPSEFMRMELALPRSRLDFRLGIVSLIGTAEWRNLTYAMSGDDGEPDDLTSEDILVSGGLQLRPARNFSLTLEAGMLFERSLTVEGEIGKDKLELDSAPFARVTLGGAF